MSVITVLLGSGFGKLQLSSHYNMMPRSYFFETFKIFWANAIAGHCFCQAHYFLLRLIKIIIYIRIIFSRNLLLDLFLQLSHFLFLFSDKFIYLISLPLLFIKRSVMKTFINVNKRNDRKRLPK